MLQQVSKIQLRSIDQYKLFWNHSYQGPSQVFVLALQKLQLRIENKSNDQQ